MTSERPPRPEREEADLNKGRSPSGRPPDDLGGGRSASGRHADEPHILERLVPEIIKRIVEAGYERISEGPENVRRVVGDLKLPKEALGVIFGQLEETKNGLYRAVAREVRDFLENTNVSEELTRALTSLSFEIKTEVRFIPNEARSRPPVPDVRSRLSVKRRDSRPPQPAEAETQNAPPIPDRKEGT
ncbi:MAG TPA: hypothetical protein VGP93_06440 [Polyangiaceae bacterium]|nr:hypothetical protein [Polyangiaceae bacterium]